MRTIWCLLLLAPLAVLAQECQTSEDCFGIRRCVSSSNTTAPGICESKPLFDPFSTADILMTCAAIFACTISAGTGMGGGGMLVPFYTLAIGSTPLAIPLAKASVFGSTIGNVIMLVRRRHPVADRPLIDYSSTLLLESASMAGTIPGVILNTLLPGWIVVTLLFCLMSFVSFRTIKSGVLLWRTERDALKVAAGTNGSDDKSDSVPMIERVSEEEVSEETPPTTDNGSNEGSMKQETLTVSAGELGSVKVITEKPTNEETENTENEEKSAELEAILEDESRTPWKYIISLIGIWSVILMAALIKGGHGKASIVNATCGGVIYWGIVAIAPMLIGCVLIVVGRHLISRHRRRVQACYVYCAGDVVWTAKRAAMYTALFFASGIGSGLLGIGGGLTKSPLMLELGVLPEIVAATMPLMVMFTSSSTTTQFLVLGTIGWDYALWLAGVAAASAALGQFLFHRLLRRFKRKSIIVLGIGLIIGNSTVLMIAIGIMGVVKSGFEGIHDLC